MEALNTKSLTEISRGLLAAAIDSELASIHADLADRPGNKKPRELTIKLRLTPIPDDDNPDMLRDADVEFQVSRKVPAQTLKRRMKSIPGRNSLGFETDTDSTSFAHNQRRFPELEEKESLED